MFRILSAFVLSTLSAMAAGSAANYSPEIAAKLQVLRDAKSARGLPLAAGHTTGFPGHTGAFFSCFPYLMGNATIPEIERMIKDPQPVIRIMGAKIMTARSLWLDAVTALDNDQALVDVTPWSGAMNETKTLTVAEFMAELGNNPDLLTQTDLRAAVELTAATPLDPASPGTVIASPLPRFPLELARAGLQGTVTIRVTFQASRSVAVQVVTSTMKELEAPVLWAARQWRLFCSPDSGKSASDHAYEFTLRFKSPYD